MAATVLFLAGPGGVFYNEQIVYPDGGMLIKFIQITCILTICRSDSCLTSYELEAFQVPGLGLSQYVAKDLSVIKFIPMLQFVHGYISVIALNPQSPPSPHNGV